MMRKLDMITIMPTPINIFLMGSLPTKRAASGAAIIPPTINPSMDCQ